MCNFCGCGLRLYNNFDTLYTGVLSSTIESTSSRRSCSLIDVSRLKSRYRRQPSTAKTSWPRNEVIGYVRLALVKMEDVPLIDEKLNEVTKLTLQGDVDRILKYKETLNDLRDIFHYENKPCPRLIVILGGPG